MKWKRVLAQYGNTSTEEHSIERSEFSKDQSFQFMISELHHLTNPSRHLTTALQHSHMPIPPIPSSSQFLIQIFNLASHSFYHSIAMVFPKSYKKPRYQPTIIVFQYFSCPSAQRVPKTPHTRPTPRSQHHHLQPNSTLAHSAPLNTSSGTLECSTPAPHQPTIDSTATAHKLEQRLHRNY